MSIHENEERLQDYLEGGLRQEEKLAFERHLVACAECRTALQQARVAETTLRGLKLRSGPDLEAKVMQAVRKNPLTRPDPSWAERLSQILSPGLAWGTLALAGLLVLWLSSPWLPPSDLNGPRPSPDDPRLIALGSSSAPILGTQIWELARADGRWSSPSVASPGPLGDGCLFRTEANGALMLAFRTDSSIHLLPGSRALTGREGIILSEGSLWCEIAPQDRNHPFVVSSGDHKVTVVGTRFGVRRSGEILEIDLFAGQVDLVPASGTHTRLEAGRQALLGSFGVREEPLSAAHLALWEPFLSAEERRFPQPVQGPASGAGPATAGATSVATLPSEPSTPVGPATATVGTDTAAQHGTADDPLSTLEDHQPTQD